MNVQSFSPAALRRAWDLRVRRGDNLQGFFPDLKPIHTEIAEARRKKQEELRRYRVGSIDRADIKKRHNEVLIALRTKYDDALTTNLYKLSQELETRIQRKSLGIRLVEKPPLPNDAKQKNIYGYASNDASDYFLSRQVEHNIRSALKIEPPNRNLATQQLLLTLENPSKELIIRTDISSYYETIPHRKLREQLKSSSNISQTTNRYIDELLSCFQDLTGAPYGIPRGLSISATLGEAYLQQLDAELRMMEGVIIYLRYVDDIVMVINTGKHLPTAEQQEETIHRAVENLGLTLNKEKTSTIQLNDETQALCSFDYLGYKYSRDGRTFEVDITDQRKERYCRRIDAAFSTYQTGPQDARATAMLHDRIRYLTSNTRLSNNRRQALVGIYFSNSTLVEASPHMHQLDALLGDHLAQNPTLPPHFTENTHVGGFSSKRFIKFSPKRLSQIVKAWKHDK